MPIEKVNIRKKFNLFQEHWSPKILGELNGQTLKAVKMLGEFVWHRHEQEDEMFLVTKGVLKMEFRDHVVEVGEGEFIIVPRQTDHRPVAEDEVHVLLFEPAATLNTGNVVNEKTKKDLEKI